MFLQKAIHVLVRSPLSRRMWIREVDLHSCGGCDAFVLEHLIALVPGQRPSQYDRRQHDACDESVPDDLGGVSTTDRDQDGQSHLVIDENRDGVVKFFGMQQFSGAHGAVGQALRGSSVT